MDKHRVISVSQIRYVHEVLFSLNLALASLAIIFLYRLQPLVHLLFNWEVDIRAFLRLRPTDFHEGYWAIFMPGVLVALFIWGVLRLSSHTRATHEVLRSVAGITAFVSPGTFWLCGTYIASSKNGWSALKSAQFYELILAAVCVLLYLSNAWPIPKWGDVVMILLHYTFWFWQFGPFTFFMGYGGPLAPAIALGSTVAWAVYVSGSGVHQQYIPGIDDDLARTS
jgi:hypothetical protein